MPPNLPETANSGHYGSGRRRPVPPSSRYTVLPLDALDNGGPGGLAPSVAATGLSRDTNCVLSAESLPGITERSFGGPVERYVWDLADAYPAPPEDTGMHLLLAPAARPVRNFTSTLLGGLIRFLRADPAKDRVVAEPDARNTKAIGRLMTFGFAAGAWVQLAEKEAQLVFLTREGFESRA